MASVATNATLRDNASVTVDGGVGEAADPDEAHRLLDLVKTQQSASTLQGVVPA